MYNQFLHPPHIQVVNPVDLQENIVKLKPVVVQLAVVQENILDQHKFVYSLLKDPVMIPHK